MAVIDGRTLDHKTLEHLRIQAVRRVVEDGEQPSKVMASMGLCRTTIYPWLEAYRENGFNALAESIAKGPEPLLNNAQRQQVNERAKRKSISSDGWTSWDDCARRFGFFG